MTFVSNNAEGASSGTSVTLANSDDNGAGSALDISSSGTRQYSNTWAHSGSTSFKCEGTSGNTAILGWDSTVGGSLVTASAAKTFRCYFRFPAAPSASCDIVQIRNTGSGGGIQLHTDRKLNITDDAGTVKFTTTAALAVDTVYRLEVRYKHGASTSDGTIEFKYFAGDSTTALDSYLTTTANQGTTDFNGFRWGKLTAVASTETYYFDDVWDHRDERALPFQYGLTAGAYRFDFGLISMLDTPKDLGFDGKWVFPGDAEVKYVVESGRGAMQWQKQFAKEACTERSYVREWEGLTVCILASSHARSSSWFPKEAIPPTCDALMCWRYDGRSVKFSLYHAPGHEDKDLSIIAKKYGGGGHAGACGFELPLAQALEIIR
jgi:hypothetical protein